MVTELGYCNLCEKQKMICRDHHCTICYELYCENCYYEKIYENDLCQKCTDDINGKNKEDDELYEDTEEDTENEDTKDTENEETSLKKQFDRLRETVRSLQLQNEKFKQKQCLLIALETIDLRNDITRQDTIDIKYTIKELLYNNSSEVVDNNEGLHKTIIEELSGLKLNCIYESDSYSSRLSVSIRNVM
jgi:signal recognition particle GTPase